MRIHDIELRKIFDSRGEPTIRVTVIDTDGRRFNAEVASGKSKGAREVSVFSFDEATSSINKIKESVAAKTFEEIGEIDAFLLGIDGTPEKKILGGNVMLGVSIAAARALAHAKRKQVWELIRNEYFEEEGEERVPMIFSNFVNGGAHANNNLDVQEYLIIARTTDSVVSTVARLIDLYRATGDYLKEHFEVKNLPIGDEGGYSYDFRNNLEPLIMLEKLIDEHDLEHEFMLGIDAAATSFGSEAGYVFEGKKCTREKLLTVYEKYFSKLKLLFSIEDPFGENDVEGFKMLRTSEVSKWVVGDDLTTTNAAIIDARAKDGAINAVIVKPNQIGTIAESCAAIQMAHQHGVKVIISHRSGETSDTFIIELAKACRADGVKIGAPAKERLIKFNALLELYA